MILHRFPQRVELILSRLIMYALSLGWPGLMLFAADVVVVTANLHFTFVKHSDN